MKTVLRFPYTEGYKAGESAVENNTRTTGADKVADFQQPYYLEGFKHGVKNTLKERE